MRGYYYGYHNNHLKCLGVILKKKVKWKINTKQKRFQNSSNKKLGHYKEKQEQGLYKNDYTTKI